MINYSSEEYYHCRNCGEMTEEGCLHNCRGQKSGYDVKDRALDNFIDIQKIHADTVKNIFRL